jgi:hypothetical protein
VSFYRWTEATNGTLSGSVEGAGLSIAIVPPEMAVPDEKTVDTPFTGFISGKRISLTSHAGGTISGTISHNTLTLTVPDTTGAEHTDRLKLATVAQYNATLEAAKGAMSRCVQDENINPNDESHVPSACYAFILSNESANPPAAPGTPCNPNVALRDELGCINPDGSVATLPGG